MNPLFIIHFFMKHTFITSDIWFNRPTGDMSNTPTSEYNDMIISNWNKIVSKKDTVYILGGLGISDMYHILIKLNGEIHIMNNVFTEDEKYFISILKESIENSIDKKLKNKIIFENSQILSLPEFDAILSYFPLDNWSGHITGTYCFHGIDSNSKFSENKISCKIDNWNYKPISIFDIQDNLKKFKKNVKNS